MTSPSWPQLGFEASFEPSNRCKVRPRFAGQDRQQCHIAHADLGRDGPHTSSAHRITDIHHELPCHFRERVIGRHVRPWLAGELNRRLPHRTSHTTSVFGGNSGQVQTSHRHATSARLTERPVR